MIIRFIILKQIECREQNISFLSTKISVRSSSYQNLLFNCFKWRHSKKQNDKETCFKFFVLVRYGPKIYTNFWCGAVLRSVNFLGQFGAVRSCVKRFWCLNPWRKRKMFKDLATSSWCDWKLRRHSILLTYWSIRDKIRWDEIHHLRS